MTIKSARCMLVCRVYWAWHSVKCVNFAECFDLDTRQTLETLPSVLVLTLGKLYKHYRVFWNWHTAKFINFAECFSVVHSAKSPSPCHPVNIFLPRVYFYRVFIDTRQTICRVRDKKTLGKLLFADKLMSCVVCRVLHSAKHLPSVFGPLPSAPSTWQSYCIP